ncbi:MAG: indole-3-glycerol phosphate synthase TrpC [Ignavibacteriaceae bacterium]
MNILDEILEVKKREVSELKKSYSLSSFTDFEFFSSNGFSFSKNIRTNKNLSIIAEIKKASPSKGILREEFNHLKIAEEYFKAGVQAVSVLTDKLFFRGDINFLYDIAKFKEAPLLRKDFIISEYQVYEAKAKGADIILLISEALSKAQINELTNSAKEIGLEVLLELHSADQFEKIDLRLNNIIGINNRNLEDFSVTLDTTAILSENILNRAEDVLIVSESGISTKANISFLKKLEIDAILVGEYLMSTKDIKGKIEELKEWCSDES